MFGFFIIIWRKEKKLPLFSAAGILKALGLSGSPLLTWDKFFKERNLACQTLSLQNDRESSCFLSCEGCLLRSCRVGEASVQNQPIGAKVLVLCIYFGSAVLVAIQYPRVLLL